MPGRFCSEIPIVYWMTISTRRFCGSRTPSPVCTSKPCSPRPITEIAGRLAYPNLSADVATVLDTRQVVEREVRLDQSDAIFLMGIDATAAMEAFDPREGVDVVWPGKGVIYSQRLSAQRTKSRLSKIAVSPHYKSMTIRSWATAKKLAELVEALEAGA